MGVNVEYELHCGDCLEIMPTLGKIDAVITDPPYGINFQYNTHIDTPEGYGDWIWNTISTAENLCSEGSPIFVFQAMLNVRHFANWFPRNWRIFAACKNFVQMRPTAMQYAFDPVLVWWTDGKRYSAGTNSRDWHIGNTANTLNRGAGDAMGHPCARPLDQMMHILEQWTRPGSIVLDPFMGSGSTGVAAMLTGRRFIGIELDATYFAIAQQRIEDAARQTRGEFRRVTDTQTHEDLPLFAGA